MRHPMSIAALLLGLLMLAGSARADDPPARPAGPAALTPEEEGTGVVLETSLGDVALRLLDLDAPLTVARFLELVDGGFYDGTIFHRVLPNLVQGGGYTAALERRALPVDDGSTVRSGDRRALGHPFPNEATVTPPNRRGTVAWVHLPALPNTATGEFFINVENNAYLDHRDRSPGGFGWAVFAEVIDGMDTVDAIAALPTGPRGPFVHDVPLETVTILSIRRARN
ncbi:MAG: peptidylprolyl isomerase [Candidatus Eiseniibacteriota bacterium]|jgi:cyclophilin family peptidyl-prolyl cis-trans isomerase